MPGKAMVRKGTVITIKGFLRDPNNPVVGLGGRLEARSNSESRATTTAKGGVFSLTWDTKNETRPITKFEIRCRIEGQNEETTLRTCNVTLVPDEPLTAAVTQDDSGVALQLQASSGLSADDPKFYINGAEVPAAGGRIAAKYLASPDESAIVQVVSQATRGSEKVGQISASVPVKTTQALTLAASKIALTLPENPFQTFFAFDVKGAMKDGTAAIFVNGRQIPTDHENGRVSADPQFFRPDEGGVLWVKATTPDGLSTFSRKISVTDLGIPNTWIELANRIDEERGRLRSAFTLTLGKFDIQNVETMLTLGTLYNKKDSQKETSTIIKLRSETRVFVRPGKKKPLRVAVTRKPIDIGGITLRTVRVIPSYGQLDQIAGDFGDLFGPGWVLTYKREKDASTLPEFIAKRFDTAEMRRGATFFGPYHKMLFDEFQSSIRAWAESTERARQAYQATKANPNKDSILAFVEALNLAEDDRLSANVLFGLLQVETGRPMPEITSYYFIPMARNKSDTDVVTSRRYESFDYINTPIDIKMFP